MPELPEVENILQSLRRALLKKNVVRIESLRQDFCPHEDKLRRMEGCVVTALKRRGKWLLMELNNQYSLLLHLGMSGRIILLKADSSNPKYALFRIVFEDEDTLAYCDMRRFGKFVIIPTCQVYGYKAIKSLGVEPLGKDLDVTLLSEMLSKSKQQIKDFLLDQKKIAGIGNIYANEILFDSKISPFKPAQALNDKEILSLYESIQRILRKAIAGGGSSINSYVKPSGEEGAFQLKHQVYGRQGKACCLCSASIRKEKQHGRSTYFCPQCQKGQE